MSNMILNSDLSTKLEERLNSLITNNLNIKEPHLNDSKSKKELYSTLSSSMDVATKVGEVMGMGLGMVGMLVAARYGIHAMNTNLAEYSIFAQAAGFTGIVGAFGGAFAGTLKLAETLSDNVKEKVNTKLGITTYAMTHNNLKEIEKDFGVEFNKEDFEKIAKSLDQSDIKETMQKAVSNVKVKNK